MFAKNKRLPRYGNCKVIYFQSNVSNFWPLNSCWNNLICRLRFNSTKDMAHFKYPKLVETFKPRSLYKKDHNLRLFKLALSTPLPFRSYKNEKIQKKFAFFRLFHHFHF